MVDLCAIFSKTDSAIICLWINMPTQLDLARGVSACGKWRRSQLFVICHVETQELPIKNLGFFHVWNMRRTVFAMCVQWTQAKHLIPDL